MRPSRFDTRTSGCEAWNLGTDQSGTHFRRDARGLRFDLLHPLENRIKAGKTEVDIQNDVINTHRFQFLELLFRRMIENAAVDGKVFRPLPLCLGGRPHAFDHATEMFRRDAGRIPSTTMIDHTLESLTHVATEDDRRVWLLYRLRSNVGLRDLKEFPAELHRIFLPDCLQRSNEFIRTASTGFELNS